MCVSALDVAPRQGDGKLVDSETWLVVRAQPVKPMGGFRGRVLDTTAQIISKSEGAGRRRGV